MELGLGSPKPPAAGLPGLCGRAGGGGQKGPPGLEQSRPQGAGLVIVPGAPRATTNTCWKGRAWTLRTVEKEGSLRVCCPDRCSRDQRATRVPERLVGGLQACRVSCDVNG